MKNTFVLFCLVMALSACSISDSNENGTELSQQKEPVPYEIVSIDHEGFELPVAIPKDYWDESELQVRFNEATGQLEVRCGEVFEVVVTEDTGNVDQLIQRLDSDLVFKYELVVHEDKALLYRQFLPNNDRSFWHFYLVVESGTASYVVKDAPMSELNEYQSRKIFDAIAYASQQLDS